MYFLQQISTIYDKLSELIDLGCSVLDLAFDLIVNNDSKRSVVTISIKNRTITAQTGSLSMLYIRNLPIHTVFTRSLCDVVADTLAG